MFDEWVKWEVFVVDTENDARMIVVVVVVVE